LADVIYAVICLANSEGIELEKPLVKVLEKLTIIDKDRFKKKK
jgi:NTP pyrophosphatase (non-canonical NTP hydrolase)